MYKKFACLKKFAIFVKTNHHEKRLFNYYNSHFNLSFSTQFYKLKTNKHDQTIHS